MISIDITGPHPKSARNNEYMITVVDVFSKFPVRNHTTPTVPKVLVDQVFSRWGTPARILMDKGPEFHSDLFSEVCKLLEVDKLHTTPYHPQTNGCVERFHLTLNRMLEKVVAENQRDWDSHLLAVLCAYRASKHESTGFTPYELVMGQKPRMPIDIVLGNISETDLSTRRILTMSKICKNGLQSRTRSLESTSVQQQTAASRNMI